MKYNVAIITSSDSGFAGNREDESGIVIKNIFDAREEYKVVSMTLLPDDKDMLKKEMIRLSESDIQLIITTGGTGFSPRDCMPEATLEVVDRVVPGIPEAMRANSMQYTKRTMLSRAVAGIRNQTLIVNLPGSPKACKENLDFIIDVLNHGLAILCDNDHNCAR